MAYDETLGDRMRPMLLPRAGVSEKAMFGGIGFLLYGNMCCGIWKDLLVVRLSPEEAARALKKPHVRVMDITGKPMKGWIFVEPKGLSKNKELLAWIESAVAFASTLPKKIR
jgi:TfoX/Sxy family transcriptional regulator of competence genes